MSPPTAPSPLAARTGGQPEPQAAHPTVEELTREAHAAMDRMGVHVPPAKLSRLIRRYLRTGQPADQFRTWFLTYADPTGEAAVRNVMRYY